MKKKDKKTDRIDEERKKRLRKRRTKGLTELTKKERND